MTSGTVGRGETLYVRDGGRIVVEAQGTITQRDGGQITPVTSTLKVSTGEGGAGTATLVNGAVNVSGVLLKSDSIINVCYRTMRGLSGSLEIHNRVSMDATT